MILYHGTYTDFDSIDKAQENFIIDHIIDQMTGFMIQDFQISLSESLSFIYTSVTYDLLCDTNNGLYIQSPSYVYELLKKEYLTASIS